MKDALSRLQNFALMAQEQAPALIDGADGEPSPAFLDYCSKHNLSLDWVICGEGEMRRREAPNLATIETDATFLHGLLQGVCVLVDTLNHSASPTSNALNALTDEVVQKADRLLSDISRLNMNGETR